MVACFEKRLKKVGNFVTIKRSIYINLPFLMKNVLRYWHIPMAIVLGVVILYVGLIGYRLFFSGKASGDTNNSNDSFWTNITDSIGINTRKLQGERDGRINVLLVGVPGGDHDGPDLTDSILFVSVNVIDKKIDMFSIPRDLYVEIPGFGYNKINAAYSLGKNYQLAGGGMDTLKDTIESILGQNIDYFVKIDFDGFVKTVDTLGGIDVTVDEDIYDFLYPDGYGGYEPFSLSAGKQHLDGETALKFVRSRQTTSDFDRSRRQQKTLVAIKEAFLKKGVIGGAKVLIQVIDILSDHLETNLKVWEWERVAKIAKDWGSDLKIANHSFDNSPEGFLGDGNIGGLYVLQPVAGDFSEIQDFVAKTISSTEAPKSVSMVVNIYNATNRVGLAGSFAEELKKEGGVEVLEVDNSEENIDQSTIKCQDNKNLDVTINELKKKWNLILSKEKLDSTAKYDCEIVLGDNFILE